MEDVVTVSNRVSVNSLTFSRAPEAPDGAFREFHAVVEAADLGTGELSAIGAISGWLGWADWLPELVENPELDGSVAAMMAAAAAGIGEHLGAESDADIETVLMVDQLHLDDEWGGRKIGRRVAEQLIDLLMLAPETTLVLAHFRATPAHGHPVVRDADHEEERRKLRELHWPSGFAPWGDGEVWWLNLRSETLAS